ncbi:MAG: large Ala/Glu-rich protein [Labilithrix sp.]|nr:large Ala/Glu-rich protein [Labilithrix sp.]
MTADDQSAAANKPEGSAPGRSPIVFVTDASAEAERIGDTLRSAGYVVVDVPMSMLTARVAAQRPNAVLLDVDAEGVLAELARLRKVPGSGAIDFVYLGSGEGIVKNAEDALSNDGSAFFRRPVELGALIRKIEALTGGPMARPEARRSTPPPSLAIGRGPASHPLRDVPPSSDRPSTPSLPAPGVRTPGPPLPMSTTSLADLIDAPRSLASFGTVSHELQQLLADAELRAEVMSSPDLAMPSPEEEIEAVLPADVLASLDEPIDGDEDEEPHAPEGARGTGPGVGHEREGTGAHARGTTAGGSRQQTTGSHVRAPGTGSGTHERRIASDSPPKSITGGGITTTPTSMTLRPRTTDAVPPSTAFEPARRASASLDDADTGQTTAPVHAAPPHAAPLAPALPAPRPSSWHPPPSIPSNSPPPADLRGPSVQPAAPATSAVVLGPHDARRFFADAIARRATGALCFESERVVRRIVIREGDLVAAASGGEGESLVHFLVARGELPRDEAPRLAAKIPPYGRHAGAALVAHGWLRQDQLWQVLRAHAEWIASAILRLSRGTAQLEADPPGRLRGEPSVFGAATGAEIFVDLVRRAVPHEDALERLGGESSRLTDGPNQGLLAECNLPPQDVELLHRARGGSIADLLARATDSEIVAVVHALSLLGVVEVVPAPDFARRDARSMPDAEMAALDEEAIRARVRARLELVEEGDYFAVLGVTRDATGYEIRRAFIELRRAFEPSRILTPRLLDLTDDVRKIIVVLEEAYEILRDNARRERYRRAIDARPE